ncbi:hypothetical protein FGB62_186g020 [Gracilaria domingensis]|nr:hypothetical protein FGB62_186g020 [Gracilaria domingensis]
MRCVRSTLRMRGICHSRWRASDTAGAKRMFIRTQYSVPRWCAGKTLGARHASGAGAPARRCARGTPWTVFTLSRTGAPERGCSGCELRIAGFAWGCDEVAWDRTLEIGVADCLIAVISLNCKRFERFSERVLFLITFKTGLKRSILFNWFFEHFYIEYANPGNRLKRKAGE